MIFIVLPPFFVQERFGSLSNAVWFRRLQKLPQPDSSAHNAGRQLRRAISIQAEGTRLLEKHAVAPSAARLCWTHPQRARCAKRGFTVRAASDQTNILVIASNQELPTSREPEIAHDL
jgi:hypothetical protein